MQSYTQKELMAVLVSRQIRNGWMVWTGTSSDIPRAGALLANLTHAPDSTIILGLDLYNFHGMNPGEAAFKGLTATAGSKKYYLKTFKLDELFDDISSVDFFVVGGMQVDQYGNTNLMGIYDDSGKLVSKGPGPIGAASMAASAKTYAIVMNQHRVGNFVEKVSFRSAFGFGDGFDHRDKLGMTGGGPSVLISPSGLFHFPLPERRMKLLSYHPGITLSQIQERTGFNLDLSGNEPQTAPPSEKELEILREYIDIDGLLR